MVMGSYPKRLRKDLEQESRVAGNCLAGLPPDRAGSSSLSYASPPSLTYMVFNVLEEIRNSLLYFCATGATVKMDGIGFYSAGIDQ